MRVDIHPLENGPHFIIFRVDEYQPSSTLINLYQPLNRFHIHLRSLALGKKAFQVVHITG